MSDTVTLTRAEYEAILDRVEDAEDAAAVAEHRALVAAHGEEAIYADSLPMPLVSRMLQGEHPLRVWREHRGLTGKQLAAASGVPQGYISEIESRKKPGSLNAMVKLAQALALKIDDLV